MCICMQFHSSNTIQRLIIEMQKCLVLQSWISIDSYITTRLCLYNTSIILSFELSFCFIYDVAIFCHQLFSTPCIIIHCSHMTKEEGFKCNRWQNNELIVFLQIMTWKLLQTNRQVTQKDLISQKQTLYRYKSVIIKFYTLKI